MQSIEREESAPFGHTYAEPLAGLRVSWGSVLAGAVAILAVALILWSLALAVVALLAHPTSTSVHGSVIALWICAMAATLVGALVGGYLSGYLPGSTTRSISAAHGFLAWCVALLLSFAFQMFLVRGAATVAAAAAMQTTSLPQQMSEPMSEPMSPDGESAPGERAVPQPPGPHVETTRAGSLAIESMVGIAWSWFGTWAVALGLAVAGAAAGTRGRGTTGIPGSPRRVTEPKPFTPAPPLHTEPSV